MKTIKSTLIAGLLFMTAVINAQNGIIKGTVTGDKDQPMLFTPIAVMIDSTIVYRAETDVNGEFTIKEVTPGKYDIKAMATSYNPFLYKGVTVQANATRYVNIAMTMTAIGLHEAVVEATFVEPLVNPEFSTVQRINIDQIEHSAVGKNDIMQLVLAVKSDVMPTSDGKGLYMRGSRSGSTAYYLDGNKTLNPPNVPGMGIGEMEVLSGGVPAEYGDCTGGIILISTKDYKVEMLRKKNKQSDREASKEPKKTN